MDDDLTGIAAIAWGLHKESYYSAGGRLMRPRMIWVMTVDNYFMTGFETVGRTPRYTVVSYRNAATAQKAAVRETQRREKEGFVLHAEPRILITKGGRRSWLAGLTASTENHMDLHASLMHCINRGHELSPTVSPVS